MKQLFLFSIIMIQYSAFADQITVRADLWCPWNCNPHGKDPGIMIEIAKEVFSKHNIKIDYQLAEWDQSVKDVKAGQINSIVGADKNGNPDLIFPSVEQGQSSDAIYVNKESQWKYTGPVSLADLNRVGLNDGYEYSKEIMDYKKNNPDKVYNTKSNKPLIKNIVLVKKKRLEAFVEDPAVFNYTVKTSGMNADHVKFANIVGDKGTPIYMAFAPKHPKSKEYAQILSQGMKDLRASGRLNAIFAKYGLKDWQK